MRIIDAAGLTEVREERIEEHPTHRRTTSWPNLVGFPFYVVEPQDDPSVRVRAGCRYEEEVDLLDEAEPNVGHASEIVPAAENWWLSRWNEIIQARQ